MRPETKRFEKMIIRRRNKIEKVAQRMIYRALKSQIPEIRTVDAALVQVESISDEPVERFFRKLYGMAGKEIGIRYFDFLKRKDEFLENEFLMDMQRYAIEQAGFRISAINETTKELFREATSLAIQEANEFGYGVEKTKSLIQRYLGNSITEARARAIAQTELITASNKASFEAAGRTGLTFRKFWSTSGLPGIRDSHLQAEADSLNGISMDEPFSNGLMFPGDPRGPVEEIINCRCTVLQEPII